MFEVQQQGNRLIRWPWAVRSWPVFALLALLLTGCQGFGEQYGLPTGAAGESLDAEPVHPAGPLHPDTLLLDE